MLSIREFYARPARREFGFYMTAMVASLFFIAAGVMRLLRLGLGGFLAVPVVLGCAVAMLSALYAGKGDLTVPGKLKLAVSATALISVLVICMIL